MRSLCLGLLGLSLLAGCSPTTPLFIAQIGTQEVVEYKTLKTNRMTAAIEEDGDLLVWWGTPVEVASALARRERERELTADVASAAFDHRTRVRGQCAKRSRSFALSPLSSASS